MSSYEEDRQNRLARQRYVAKKRRRKNFIENIALGFAAFFGVIGVVMLLIAIGTGITMLIVAAAWNWAGLHGVFDQPALTFWQVFGISLALNFVRGILSGGNRVQVNK